MTTQLRQITDYAAKLDAHEANVFERAIEMSQITDLALSADLTIKALKRLQLNPVECDEIGGSRGQVRSIRLAAFKLKGVPTVRLEVGSYARWGAEYGQLDARVSEHTSVEAAMRSLVVQAIKNLQAELRELKSQAANVADLAA